MYEPITAKVPAELRGRLEPAEVFHEVLEHRWFLSEQRGYPVHTVEAADAYINRVLTARPEEVIAGEPDTAELQAVLDDS